MKKLSIIIPCYNEQETVELFIHEMVKVESKVPLEFEYIFVNDGSRDETLRVLKEAAKLKENVNYLSFSRNFGKEAALIAGLQAATGEFVTVMDVDLQDPPELLPDMYQKIVEGYDIVGTRRSDRAGEPVIRSFFAKNFYKIINSISDVKMVDGARDFRLMTRQVVDAILELNEVNRFSKGLFSWVGFDTYYISYENRERSAGETTWNFWSLFKYSLEGIINFSEAPLTIATFIGVLSCALSILSMLYFFLSNLITQNPVPGWPSLICIILFLGGLQLFCLGIVGKYIGKIFLEVKKRPNYIVKESSLDI
ncbi:glycosyltransferase [Lactococcus raffinolactis]|uniref:glycosyltransferase family 2 protein n=1 Tax=Pseudolactococcus raffinolactis TaxID=1366 RepID=UPI001C70543B|nr:glycosyltransferase family 2 protein [Lactococcus raffinolactis]MBW9297439.1 glycosyltransferase [Lactococcus raffinolactis]NBK97363.1 glycosyltransferase [Erysipelotrichia bacterium]